MWYIEKREFVDQNNELSYRNLILMDSFKSLNECNKIETILKENKYTESNNLKFQHL